MGTGAFARPAKAKPSPDEHTLEVCHPGRSRRIPTSSQLPLNRSAGVSPAVARATRPRSPERKWMPQPATTAAVSRTPPPSTTDPTAKSLGIAAAENPVDAPASKPAPDDAPRGRRYRRTSSLPQATCASNCRARTSSHAASARRTRHPQACVHTAPRSSCALLPPGQWCTAPDPAAPDISNAPPNPSAKPGGCYAGAQRSQQSSAHPIQRRADLHATPGDQDSPATTGSLHR